VRALINALDDVANYDVVDTIIGRDIASCKIGGAIDEESSGRAGRIRHWVFRDE
jgi:hypothetical protein